jgi:Rrf2 family nitric oxide-sensitive transcriptional repressor
MLYLASSKETASSKELSENLGIAQSLVLKIGKKLSNRGYLGIVTGTNGGMYIDKNPSDISLFEIIDMMESTTRINRCLEDDEYCSRYATNDCKIREAYCRIQDSLEGSLKDISISDLID